MFAGLKRDNLLRLAYGTYTNTSKQGYTHVAGRAYQTHFFLADDSADDSAVAAFPAIYVYDDPSTPARSAGAVSGSQTTTLADGVGEVANIALCFAGDCDVTVYYRLVFPPSSPF